MAALAGRLKCMASHARPGVGPCRSGVTSSKQGQRVVVCRRDIMTLGAEVHLVTCAAVVGVPSRNSAVPNRSKPQGVVLRLHLKMAVLAVVPMTPRYTEVTVVTLRSIGLCGSGVAASKEGGVPIRFWKLAQGRRSNQRRPASKTGRRRGCLRRTSGQGLIERVDQTKRYTVRRRRRPKYARSFENLLVGRRAFFLLRGFALLRPPGVGDG